ncbi:unnamed protein product [Brassica napus]|uniref:(rape) hypothetical protein n=1 Tax=Brassica napus TaxID=3708 RepID=A0A816I1N7_BRANA|nr:unnamed protein product [Brassica napus]
MSIKHTFPSDYICFQSWLHEGITKENLFHSWNVIVPMLSLSTYSTKRTSSSPSISMPTRA